MSNLRKNNKHNPLLKLNYDDYWDFYINHDEIYNRGSYYNGKYYDDANIVKIDLCNKDCISGNTIMSDERHYWDKGFAKNIAKNICAARMEKPVETTGELTEIIKKSIPAKMRMTGGHPAKKTFQAIRIELNQELEVLKNSLDDMIDLLNDEGRICVITFHSLEDRIVKTIFRRNENPCTCPPDFPVCVCGKKSKGKVITRKPILPSEEELEENTRSKSAKLRVFERML